MSNQWWNTAPGGAKGSVDGSERLPAESGGTGYTVTLNVIKTWLLSVFGTLVTSFQATPDDTHYPSEKLVKDSLDDKVNVSDLVANIALYPTTAASDLGSGYLTLVSSVSDSDYDTVAVDVSTGAITTTGMLLASLSTAPGLVVGNPGVITVTTIGNIKRISGTGSATFYFEVYHRSGAGVETLVATSSVTTEVDTETYEQFFATALFNDGSFDDTDRIVIKYYGNRVAGGSNPTFNFQFGGSSPVRTLFPVPSNVIPVPTASDIEISEIPTATWRTVQDYIQAQGSTGQVSGGEITDAGSQTFDVAAGTGFIRTTDNHIGLIRAIDWTASLGNSIVDGTTRFIYVDYNAGAPIVKTTLSRSDINHHSNFELGFVSREGTALHIVNNPDQVACGIGHVIERFRDQVGTQRASGLILGETGTRNVTVTAGEIYDKLNEHDTAAIDTSAADTFDIYRDSVFISTGNTQWPNTQYDTGAGLATLTNNRYGVLWFYVEGDDGDLVMVYGTSNAVTVAAAQAEAQPATLSGRLLYGGILIGRIIFQKGASTATLIENPFSTMFSAGEAQDHANLANLDAAASGHTGFITTGAAEISALTEKVTPVDGDWVLIEDSENGDIKKKVQASNMLGGGITFSDLGTFNPAMTFNQSGQYDAYTATPSSTVTFSASSIVNGHTQWVKITTDGTVSFVAGAGCELLAGDLGTLTAGMYKIGFASIFDAAQISVSDVIVINDFSGSYDGSLSYVVANALYSEYDLGDGATDSAFTFSMWLKVSAYPGGSALRLFRHAQSGAAKQYEGWLASDGTIGVRLFDGATSADYIGVRTTSSVPLNAWTLFVVTYDGSGVNTGYEVYINDSKEASPTRDSSGAYVAMEAANSSYRLNIGRVEDGTLKYSGLMDDFAIWNVEFSPADVTELYNNGQSYSIATHSKFANCVLWLDFENDVVDNSLIGNAFTATSLTFSSDTR